jgi:hypothetical protein
LVHFKNFVYLYTIEFAGSQVLGFIIDLLVLRMVQTSGRSCIIIWVVYIIHLINSLERKVIKLKDKSLSPMFDIKLTPKQGFVSVNNAYNYTIMKLEMFSKYVTKPIFDLIRTNWSGWQWDHQKIVMSISHISLNYSS